MQLQEFANRSHLDSSTIEAWVDAEWLVAHQPGHPFSEQDLARVRLIQDLKDDLGVNEEGIALVLHLLDQLYGLRCLLRDIQAMRTTTSDRPH
ncbi:MULTISPECIES: chaperone modulator CbpM [unclassified Bradyrhizobium]|uniref:chaperone modulator CbpM n=1 Tax=unclassified Bradyrhizobium TaxID=2631580 RepID=UPI001FF9650F|nr:MULTISPECIES: chaperone modulator CbpM [unclassified Bradyrhizobium]MCK1311819.1 MerR family transcriptional regulator [Bradyrhizobium sp. 45]MCK1367315.1 MerR family transcriptional regulator [Bradyrhizobium sp. 62]